MGGRGGLLPESQSIFAFDSGYNPEESRKSSGARFSQQSSPRESAGCGMGEDDDFLYVQSGISNLLIDDHNVHQPIVKYEHLLPH